MTRRDDLHTAEIDCLFPVAGTLEQGLDALAQKAVEQVRDGARLLLLTDRRATASMLPIPMAMATGLVHESLVKAGLRTLAGLAVEAGDARDIHHAAVLIGYGAGTVCPWLALETARSMAPEGVSPDVSEQKMLKALNAGLAKVMSKMGISVVASYRYARQFDRLGLHDSIVDRCFPETPSPISGVGFSEIEKQLRSTWMPQAVAAADLPDPGWIRHRGGEHAESHGWKPPIVKALQSVVGSARNVPMQTDSRAAFAIFSNDVVARQPAALRDLLDIRPAGVELDIVEVEAPSKLVKRFISSAMSLGSLSPEAHSTITRAMNMLGARSNTGEGGEDPDVYRPHDSGEHVAVGSRGMQARSGGGVALAEPEVEAPAVHTLLNNKIKQIASGRFGVTAGVSGACRRD